MCATVLGVAPLGFLALILQRCVLVEGVSEDLRVAGLRAANVFMARAGRAKECQVAIAAAGGAVDRRRHSDTESGIGATSCIRNANMQSKGENYRGSWGQDLPSIAVLALWSLVTTAQQYPVVVPRHFTAPTDWFVIAAL